MSEPVWSSSYLNSVGFYLTTSEIAPGWWANSPGIKQANFTSLSDKVWSLDIVCKQLTSSISRTMQWTTEPKFQQHPNHSHARHTQFIIHVQLHAWCMQSNMKLITGSTGKMQWCESWMRSISNGFNISISHGFNISISAWVGTSHWKSHFLLTYNPSHECLSYNHNIHCVIVWYKFITKALASTSQTKHPSVTLSRISLKVTTTYKHDS